MTKRTKIILISAGALAVLVAEYFIYRAIDRVLLISSMEERYVEILYAKRGDLFDCEGNLIATSKPAYDVHLDCKIIKNDAYWDIKTLELAPKLAALLPERTAAEWWDYLQAGRNAEKRYLKIATNLSQEMKDSIARLPIFNLPPLDGGAIYTSYLKRYYPYDSLGRRAIGYVRGGDNGRVGIEGKYDYYLHGVNGSRNIKSGWYKGKKEQLVTQFVNVHDGADGMVTLSMPMQALADSALRAGIGNDPDITAGCVVLMEVKTGAIRAMVNLSRGKMSYETNRLWERYNDAIAHSYEPGEVLQTMTLASVLRDGRLRSLDTKMPTRHGLLPPMPQDVHLKDYERAYKTDSISVLDAFAMSSHYGMAYLATDAYDASRNYYTESLRSFCLPQDRFACLEGLREVDITRPDGYYWEDATLSSMANGHALTMVPLDILSFYNTIANKGRMIRPYLMQKMWEGEKHATVFTHEDGGTLREEVFSAAVADTLTRALLAVTESGTGTRLRDARYPVAGKTGTARQIIRVHYDDKGRLIDPYCDEQGRFQTVATFAGFFPADDPKYSIICVLYSVPCRKTYYGGTLPALIVRDLVNRIECE